LLDELEWVEVEEEVEDEVSVVDEVELVSGAVS
jgi:hypothetical protein